MQRVFCIGLNKTGTSSLNACFEILGLGPRAPRPDPARKRATRALFERGDYEPALALAARFRAFEDRPFNVWEMYRRLDERFPGSFFILTVREPEAWWKSVDHWIHVTKPHLRERYVQHLRAADDSKDSMLRGYLRYNQEVRDYFAGREDFLAFDPTAGLGWGPLCEFLRVPVPSVPFPQRNRQSYDAGDRERRRKGPLRKAWRRLRERVAALTR
ncbi:MAG TPA: sulfotransferase [Myxococcota bacterium]|nr:sulfotransferase [Myxococcota bacterium]